MDNFSMQPYHQNNNTFGPPTQPYLPPKNHKKKMPVIILCVAAVLFAAILGGWFHHTHSASYKIRKGLQNLAREAEEMKNPLAEKLGTNKIRRMFAEEGGHVDTKMNVTTDTFLGQLTFGVDTDCDIDRQRKELAASTKCSVMNYELANLELYGDEEALCLSIPELYLENVYIENENVLDQYNHSMWAELFGEAQGDDFSINLFPDAWLFGDEEGVGHAFLTEYAYELAECGQHMTMEKAGKNLYRVGFDELYFNELIRQVLYDYVDFSKVGREEAMGILSYFDVISSADQISFLLEINDANRIDSIRVERPLAFCKGAIEVSGDIHFLGDKRSIEKIQGKLEIKNEIQKEKRETELIWQTVQSLELDDYQMESDVKCNLTKDGETRRLRLGCALECDGRKNSFDGKVSLKDTAEDMETVLRASGDFSHIVKGESFDLELEELTIDVNAEELALVRGELGLKPLMKRVERNVKAQTAFFEMPEREWDAIFEKVYRDYEYFLQSLYGFYW